ncbi:hypothetical protein GQ457_07G001770 [Hibiscus cannabinus]
MQHCESLRSCRPVPFNHKEPLESDTLPSRHRVHPKNHEPSYKFVMFGAGPRMCLGKEVAFVQMKAVAYAMIYNHHIQVLVETPVVPAISVLLHTKDGLMTRVSTRWD